jgi:hypothetical protein
MRRAADYRRINLTDIPFVKFGGLKFIEASRLRGHWLFCSEQKIRANGS